MVTNFLILVLTVPPAVRMVNGWCQKLTYHNILFFVNSCTPSVVKHGVFFIYFV